eukprot:63044_1
MSTATRTRRRIIGRCFLITMLLLLSLTLFNVFLLSHLENEELPSLNTIHNIDVIQEQTPQTTNHKHASSWNTLNEQQFCRIHVQKRSHRVFLEDVHKQQFRIDCDDSSTKYLIYDVSLETGSGLGASLFGRLTRYFLISLRLNRTFLLHGAFDWTKDATYCNGFTAMECYFLSVSKCNPVHILSTVNKNNTDEYYEGRAPNDCLFKEHTWTTTSPITTHCKQRVIYINRMTRGYIATLGLMEEWTLHLYGLRVIDYQAIASAFLLRPKPNVRAIIYDKITQSIHKSLGGVHAHVNASRTVSMPIRASDKCQNIVNITHQHYAHKAEIQCFTPLEHVQILNVLHYLSNGEMNTVILTSEDAVFVEKVIGIVNVSQWNIIQNTEDYSVGEGTTTYKKTLLKFGNVLHDALGTSLDTDPIVSALSSLMLQLYFETEYMIYLDSSSWTKLMWRWRSLLNCNTKQNGSVSAQSKCVLLQTPGYMHRGDGIMDKSVILPRDLQRKVYIKGLSQKLFFKRFGLNHKAFVRGCESVSILDPKF